MIRPMTGGRRRIDRVLAPDFCVGLPDLTLPDLRERRHEAEQEEADLSYVRRLLHGRIDIVEAERRRRDPGFEGGSVLDELTAILTDESRTTRGSGKHLMVEPSRVDEHRRDGEAIVADTVISDVEARTGEELVEALVKLRLNESEVSEVRHEVQAVMDVLSAELTRRYRDGVASVDELLSGGNPSF